MSSLCATKILGVNLAVDRIISSTRVTTDSIIVHSMFFGTRNVAGVGPCVIEDGDGNTIFTFMIPADVGLEIEATWIADGGFKVKAIDNITYCTVAYTEATPEI